MKYSKSEIVFFLIFIALGVMLHFSKDSIYDDYLVYAQTGVLIILIIFLVKKGIYNFRNGSLSSEGRKSMLINMLLTFVMLLIAYFVINASIKIY